MYELKCCFMNLKYDCVFISFVKLSTGCHENESNYGEIGGSRRVHQSIGGACLMVSMPAPDWAPMTTAGASSLI